MNLGKDIISYFELQIFRGQAQAEVSQAAENVSSSLTRLYTTLSSLISIPDITISRGRNKAQEWIILKAPCDRLRLVFRIIFKALFDRQYVYSETELVPAVDIEIRVLLGDTSPGLVLTRRNIQNAGKLVDMLILAETFIPSKFLLELKLMQYVNNYGEMTAAAKCNLELICQSFEISQRKITEFKEILTQQMKLPKEENNKDRKDTHDDFQDFKRLLTQQSRSLTDRYNDFRELLSAYKAEKELSGDYTWLQIQSAMMNLPEEDFIYLINERRKEILMQ
jgi:hypothetical protein